MKICNVGRCLSVRMSNDWMRQSDECKGIPKNHKRAVRCLGEITLKKQRLKLEEKPSFTEDILISKLDTPKIYKLQRFASLTNKICSHKCVTGKRNHSMDTCNYTIKAYNTHVH